MKVLSISLIVAGSLFCMKGNAQISFKTEYFGNSGYYYMSPDKDKSEKVGNSKGSAIVYQGNANLPFYMKKNENDRITAWGVGLGGAYASLNNKNFTTDMVSEIMNLQLGIFHLRPLNDKWSMMAIVGAGTFTPFTDFSKIEYKHVLGMAGATFIRHLKPNLDIGGGLTINSSFGYPMVFPSIYFNWKYESKLETQVSVGEGVEMSVKYGFNDYFSLSFAFDMSGQLALLEKDGKDVIFTHQSISMGLRPEIRFGKTGLSMPFMFGMCAVRPAFYNDRTLKGWFATDNNYYFRPSLYASASLKYGF